MYTETDMNDEWIPINIAARMLGVSGPAIRKWVTQGKLRCVVKAEDRPRLGNQCKRIKHVSLKELSSLHERIPPGRSCAK